jgi:hypothetical protein
MRTRSTINCGKNFALLQRLRERLAVRHRVARFGNGFLDDAVGDDLLGDFQRGEHRHAVLEQRPQRPRELAEQIQLDHLAEHRRLQFPFIQLRAPSALA